MTEQDWMAETDPGKMLDALRTPRFERKLTLYAVACLRAVLPPDLLTAYAGLIRAFEGMAEGRPLPRARREEATRAGEPFVRFLTDSGFLLARNISAVVDLDEADRSALRVVQRARLLDIVDNPVRPVSLKKVWRDNTVRLVSAGLNQRRDQATGAFRNDDLAVLSDALEDAGCDEQALLGHLRSPGPHVLGCWGVDRVTGKR